MEGQRRANVWAVFALVGIVQGMAPAAVAAEAATDAACVVSTSSPRPQTHEAAASRTGRLPGLGSVSAAIGFDNRKQVTLAADDFAVTRVFTPLTRELEITISGRGEAPLVIRLGGQGLEFQRGSRMIRGTADADAIRSILGGRAIAAFRERIGNYERRLMAGERVARLDDVHADGFLLVGAFVASMAGDSTAVGRARDLIMRRVYSKTRSVRFDFKDCVTDYERYLLQIDTQRTHCLSAANGRDAWYARAADRLGCEVEFMAQALAGEGQFISCTALGAIVG